ncbi:hypothetical protein BQ8420_21190 [Nocardiopsis sp. JB363]|nr:hypothetical protein BQ8420_21190 [Nocardiopsis sp. JB363]
MCEGVGHDACAPGRVDGQMVAPEPTTSPRRSDPPVDNSGGS